MLLLRLLLNGAILGFSPLLYLVRNSFISFQEHLCLIYYITESCCFKKGELMFYLHIIALLIALKKSPLNISENVSIDQNQKNYR